MNSLNRNQRQHLNRIAKQLEKLQKQIDITRDEQQEKYKKLSPTLKASPYGKKVDRDPQICEHIADCIGCAYDAIKEFITT